MSETASLSTSDGATRVLYIAGALRSGTTLLDRVIGGYGGFCSAGEVQNIWKNSFDENQLCGCGAPFRECVFWGEVSNRALGHDADKFDPTAAIHLQDSVDRIRHIPLLVSPRRPKHYQSALMAYGELISHLYTAIREVSGEKVIVDSSKSPAHAMLLSKLPGFEVHVVHLVRDPRAVAFSWQRQRRRPEIHWKTEDMPIERISTSVYSWIAYNGLAELLSPSKMSYCRLRYEDFVADPTVALAKVLAPYEWIETDPAKVDTTEMVLEPTHTVSGNPMRFKSGKLKLELDDEWCRVMRPHDRRLVTALTWPLLMRYGYPLGAW
jgi:hypothetical protein